MFLEAKKATKHIIYLGGLGDKLKRVAKLMDSNIYSPKELTAGATYFWRVDAIVTGKVVKGEVWSFTVAKQ